MAESGIFTKDYREGGIFFYSKHQKERTTSTKFSGGEKSDVKKYSEMVAYLLEIAYHLALGPVNVSGSTGFEGCGLNL